MTRKPRRAHSPKASRKDKIGTGDPHVFTLLKVVSCQDHADTFRNGLLYVRTLSYFKELEEGEDGRGDHWEGATGLTLPDRGCQLWIGGVEIPLTRAGGFVSMVHEMPSLLTRHTFCMYTIESGPFGKSFVGDFNDFLKYVRIPDRVREWGPLAVVVTDPGAFGARIKAAMNRHGFSGKSRLVKYYDPQHDHGMFDPDEFGFRKRVSFRYQREWRLLFDARKQLKDPDFLDIGDIRDITMTVEVERLNELLKFKDKKADTG